MDTLSKNQNTDVLEVINNIKEGIKLCNTIVFCGAGISRDSGLPVVNQFVPYILEKFEVSDIDKKFILDKENNPKIPFEAFIEGINYCTYIDSLLDVYNQGEPNTNHILLSKLIKTNKIKTIITTNFDKLIEKALNLEPNPMQEGKDFDVIYQNQDFEKINWNDNRVRIIKIHGSVEDKEEMAITIKQVASKVLSEARKTIISHVFSNGNHKNVLILGYSSSDIFDLSHQIKAVNTNHKKVYYVQHSDDCKVEAIQEQIDKNPFKKFTNSLRLYINTTQLIKNIWESCLEKNEHYQLKKGDINWKENIDGWWNVQAIKDPSNTLKYSIPAYIFTEMGLSNIAIKYYESGLQIAIEHKDKISEGIYFGNLGNAYFNIGQFEISIKYSKSAIDISREIKDKKSVGMWLGNIACAYYSLGNTDLSKQYTQEALNIALEINDRRSVGRYLGNLANDLLHSKEYSKAEDLYNQAINVALEIGDKVHEGLWLSHLGTMNLKLLQENISKQDMSKEIIAQIDELIIKTENYLIKALITSQDIVNKINEGVCYSNLGTFYGFIMEFDKSLENYNNALVISREIEDKIGEGIRLGNLGNLFLLKEEYTKSIEYSEAAIIILKPMLGDDHSNVKLFNKNLLAAKSKLI